MKKVIKLRTDGIVQLIDLPDIHDFKWFGQQIGCEWIENVYPIRLEEPYVMVVDEEALLKNSPVINYLASYLYETYKHGHPICGNVLIMRVDAGPNGPDLAGMEAEEAEKMAAIFRNQMPFAVKRVNQKIGEFIRR